jgi:O-antigen/teichoic acid export membrane protein
MKYFGLCYIPEGLFRPIIFLVLVVALVSCGFEVFIFETSALFAAVTFGIAVAVWVLLQKLLPRWEIQPWRAGRLARQWRREAWPLILLSLFTNYFVDIAIICATPFLTSADVAVFGLCLKLALLVGYAVQVGQQMAVPDLAVARRSANTEEIGNILRRSMFVPIVATAGAIAVIAVFGKMLLSIFGASFAVGQTALILLVLSQFVRAVAGPSAHLLTLTGAQRVNAALCAAIAVLLLTNLVLVPALGLTGAALAVVATYTFWVASVAYTLHGMGEFRTDVFAVFRPKPAAKVARAAGLD